MIENESVYLAPYVSVENTVKSPFAHIYGNWIRPNTHSDL